jgi:hypothetical protein
MEFQVDMMESKPCAHSIYILYDESTCESFDALNYTFENHSSIYYMFLIDAFAVSENEQTTSNKAFSLCQASRHLPLKDIE